MSALRARRVGSRHLSVLMACFLVGCGGSAPAPAVSAENPRTGPRRKEMSEFMKNQPAAGQAGSPAGR